MTGIMPYNNYLKNLRDTLAGLYFSPQEIIEVAQDAELKIGRIRFDAASNTIWHNIVDEARKQGPQKVENLIDRALKDFEDNPGLLQAKADKDHTLVRGPEIDKVDWKTSPDEGQLEKIMGRQSTLLPISFLEMGQNKARSVVRVVRHDELGSGFLIDNNILVTNNHVLETPEQAAEAKIQFNYQRSVKGNSLQYVEVELDPFSENGFATSVENDWTAVRVKGDLNSTWGFLPLEKAEPKVEDFTIIIQHPEGGPKQISLYHNVITAATDTRLQYLTDTMPGSSGSPVFNTDWNVIGLHHSGGWLPEPNTQQKVYRNQGIHINVVIDGLIAAGMLAA